MVLRSEWCVFFTCSTAKSHKGKICQKYRTLDSLSQYQSVSCRASIILLVHTFWSAGVDVMGCSMAGLPWLRRMLVKCAFHKARRRDGQNRWCNDPRADHHHKLLAIWRRGVVKNGVLCWQLSSHSKVRCSCFKWARFQILTGIKLFCSTKIYLIIYIKDEFT